jgi:hypothetical protein
LKLIKNPTQPLYRLINIVIQPKLYHLLKDYTRFTLTKGIHQYLDCKMLDIVFPLSTLNNYLINENDKLFNFCTVPLFVVPYYVYSQIGDQVKSVNYLSIQKQYLKMQKENKPQNNTNNSTNTNINNTNTNTNINNTNNDTNNTNNINNDTNNNTNNNTNNTNNGNNNTNNDNNGNNGNSNNTNNGNNGNSNKPEIMKIVEEQIDMLNNVYIFNQVSSNFDQNVTNKFQYAEKKSVNERKTNI